MQLGSEFVHELSDIINLHTACARLNTCGDVRPPADIANHSDIHVPGIDMKHHTVSLFLLDACEGHTVTPDTGFVQGQRPSQDSIPNFINNRVKFRLL
jgi:hypothetical protein